MKTKFITFGTENYSCILDNLVESILAFSKHDVIVYSINFIYKHDSNRVYVKPIFLENLNYYQICKTKIFSAIDSNVEIGLCLDADMIVTKDIDYIFEENLDKLLKSNYPLFCKHPHKPLETNFGYLETIKQYTDKPNDTWVYATFLYSKNNIWFLKEVYEEMCSKENQLGEDELIINGLLSKYAVNYDIGYNYIPNGLDEMFDIFFGLKENNEENNHYLKHNCPVKFYAFHAHKIKDCKFGKNLINKINHK